MPCRCDGYGDEPLVKTQDEIQKEEIDRLTKMLCNVLTVILIEDVPENVREMNIKNEALRCLHWLKDHLRDDIKKCESELAKVSNLPEIGKWNGKWYSASLRFKKASELFDQQWKGK